MNTYEEIGIMDVMYRILYRWKLVLCIGILLAAGMGGYRVYKNRQYNLAIENTNSQETTSGGAYVTLSGTDKDTVDVAVETYSQLYGLLDVQKNSVYGEINAYSLNVVSIIYKIDLSGDVGERNSDNLLEAYVTKANTYVSDSQTENFLVWPYSPKLSKDVITEQSMAEDSIFTVYVAGADEGQVDELTDRIKEEFNTYKKVLDKEVCRHELKILEEKKGYANSETLALNQYNLITRINTLQTYLTNITTKFSPVQQQAYNQMIAEKYNPEGTVAEPVAALKVPLSSGVKKYGIIGLFIGFCMACMAIVAFYVLGNQLRTARGFTQKYGIDVIETFEGLNSQIEKKRLFVIDKKIQELKNKGGYTLDVKKSMLCSNMVNMCRQRDLSEICVVSTIGLSDEEKNFVTSVVEQMQKSKIAVTICDNVLKDMDSFEQMSEIKQVVLLEKTAVSKNDSIEQLYNVCKLQSIQILGAIIL